MKMAAPRRLEVFGVALALSAALTATWVPARSQDLGGSTPAPDIQFEFLNGVLQLTPQGPLFEDASQNTGCSSCDAARKAVRQREPDCQVCQVLNPDNVSGEPSQASPPLACDTNAACQACPNSVADLLLLPGTYPGPVSAVGSLEHLVDPLSLIAENATLRARVEFFEQHQAERDEMRDSLLEVMAENQRLQAELGVVVAQQKTQAEMLEVMAKNMRLEGELELAKHKYDLTTEYAAKMIETERLKAELASYQAREAVSVSERAAPAKKKARTVGKASKKSGKGKPARVAQAKSAADG